MSRRARAGVAGLIVCAASLAAGQLVRNVLAGEPNEHEAALVAEYDTRRFAGVADLLPPGEVVGYVTNDPEPTRAYYLAQYVLAPCIIVRGEGPRLVLVDDRPESEERPVAVDRRLLRDGGDGVRLYVREGPR
jgi:hypothetical protein